MSDPICDIFPDEPQCQVEEPEPAPEPEDDVVEDEDDGAEEEAPAEEEDAEPAEKVDYSEAAATAVASWTAVKEMSSFAMLSPMKGNVTLLMVALGGAMYSALEAFRYRSASTYYDFAKIDTDSNLYKTSDTIRLYGGVAIGGLLTVTSLMAVLGISPLLNGMAWMYGSLAMMVVSMIVGVTRFMAYENAYGHASNTTTTTYNSAGNNLMSTIRWDSIEDAGHEAAAMLALYGAMESVHYGLWNAKTDEERATAIAEWEETVAVRAEEIAAARVAAPAEEEEGEEAEEGEEGAEGEEAAEGEEGAEEGEEEEGAEEEAAE